MDTRVKFVYAVRGLPRGKNYFHRVVLAAQPTAEPLPLAFATVERRERSLAEFGSPINPDGLRAILVPMSAELGGFRSK